MGLLLAGVAVPGASAVASVPRVAAVCTASLPINLSPGLQLLKATQGTNQSFGESGILNCIGTLDGLPIAGPGTIGFSGNYSGKCSGATGIGTWSFTIPVNDHGITELIQHSGTYSAPNVGVVLTFDGQFQTGSLKGAGVVLASQGDCVLKPITKGTLPMVGVTLTQ